MKIGAVIVAAGMSERMRRFRELMEIGNLTMAERTVTSFQRAGADRIVMVTGYRSAYLKKNLSSLGIDFAENPDYETTEMFESVKIGLDADRQHPAEPESEGEQARPAQTREESCRHRGG